MSCDEDLRLTDVVDLAKSIGSNLRRLSFFCADLVTVMSQEDFVDIVDVCPNWEVCESSITYDDEIHSGLSLRWVENGLKKRREFRMLRAR